jgi:hypothetical protein
MRGKGISYDTGFISNTRNAREPFDPEVVKRELRIIRDDLHCNAVRIMGGDPERLEVAATYAADLGLEVWFSPYPLELTTDELLALFTDCAERAERLRRRGAEVVFVTGAELSLMNKGFLPGDTFNERLDQLLNQPHHRRRELIPEVTARVNQFLTKATALVRERFGGKLTYAAIQQLERVDWTPFDFLSVDLYRSAEVADRFPEGVRALVAQGKPVAITEFGAATYRGAGDRGARGLEIVEYDKDTGAPVRLDGEYVRDEQGPGHLPARAAGGLPGRRRRQHLRVHLRAPRLLAPARRRPARGPGPGQLRHRQGAGRPPRRGLPRHGLGAQGRLQAARGPLPRLTTGPSGAAGRGPASTQTREPGKSSPRPRWYRQGGRLLFQDPGWQQVQAGAELCAGQGGVGTRVVPTGDLAVAAHHEHKGALDFEERPGGRPAEGASRPHTATPLLELAFDQSSSTATRCR